MIVAHMATYPPRRQSMLDAVARLVPQVDRLTVVLNQYADVPDEFQKWQNVEGVLLPRNLLDLGKFYPDCKTAEWVFLVDDDLIYPKDYVQTALSEIQKAKTGSVVGGYHATIYKRPKPGLNLLKTWRWFRRTVDPRRDRQLIGYWRALDRPTIVSQLGTGTVVLPGHLMPGFSYMEGSERAVDIRFARWCHDNGIAQIALPRARDWLGGVDHQETIFGTFTNKMPPDKQNELTSFAYDVKGLGGVL